MLNLALVVVGLHLGSFERSEVWNLRRLRQLHMRRLSGHIGIFSDRCGNICLLGRWLRETGRVLRASFGHGPRISGVRILSESNWTSDDLLLQLAGVSNLRRHATELLFNHSTLQSVAQLRWHSGLLVERGEHYGLLRQQSGQRRAQCRSRPLEWSRYGESYDYVH